MPIAVIAEKPSVARDIARVVGARQTGQGYLHGDGYIVTWAIGHLVALAQPHEINTRLAKANSSSITSTTPVGRRYNRACNDCHTAAQGAPT